MVHPNIVKYYGGGNSSGQRWYAMELVDGGSLQDILKKKKRLSWDQAIQVGRQLCAALEVAHTPVLFIATEARQSLLHEEGQNQAGGLGIARDTEATH